MSTNKDLLSIWMEHQQNKSDESQTTEPKLSSPSAKDSQPPETPIIPPERRAKASLSGRLSEFLAKQPPRDIVSSSEKLESKHESWSIDDRDDRAVVAMSLILASHLVRFGQTRLSENHLLQTRDSILHTMTASDAVRVEVEAYEILNWFAGAMNDSWKEKKAEQDDCQVDPEACSSVESIIQYAIQNHIDLEMHYYTGSRGEFSERRITPIEITAEKYLIAFCHLRNEERVFRLSRIVQLSPAEKTPGYEKLCYPRGKDTLLPPLPALPDVKKPDKSASSSRKTAQKSKKPRGNTESAAKQTETNDIARKKTDSKAPNEKVIKTTGKKKTAKSVAPRQKSLFES